MLNFERACALERHSHRQGRKQQAISPAYRREQICQVRVRRSLRQTLVKDKSPAVDDVTSLRDSVPYYDYATVAHRANFPLRRQSERGWPSFTGCWPRSLSP